MARKEDRTVKAFPGHALETGRRIAEKASRRRPFLFVLCYFTSNTYET